MKNIKGVVIRRSLVNVPEAYRDKELDVGKKNMIPIRDISHINFSCFDENIDNAQDLIKSIKSKVSEQLIPITSEDMQKNPFLHMRFFFTSNNDEDILREVLLREVLFTAECFYTIRCANEENLPLWLVLMFLRIF